MSALSGKLRLAQDNTLIFWCPGCDHPHAIKFGAGEGLRWTWNGDAEKPTFTPSVHVASGHYSQGFKQGESCWCTYAAEHPNEKPDFLCTNCHSFVTDGHIQFLGDCTHALANQTVDLPVWTE